MCAGTNPVLLLVNQSVFQCTILIGGRPSEHPFSSTQTTKISSPYRRTEYMFLHNPRSTDERAVRFEDGSIDTIILCTGYASSFPFLAPVNPRIENEGIRPCPLYAISHFGIHTDSTNEPSTSRSPLPNTKLPSVVARVWAGWLAQLEMLDWQDKRGSGRNFPYPDPHTPLTWITGRRCRSGVVRLKRGGCL